jgi:hypothetical protein
VLGVGYGVGMHGFDKGMEKVLNTLQAKSYSSNFVNLRIADNKRLPKDFLKLLRDVATPPLVIDLIPRDRH